jgi:hypothetical protein
MVVVAYGGSATPTIGHPLMRPLPS